MAGLNLHRHLDAELLLLHGPDRAAVLRRVDEVLAQIAKGGLRLQDLAFALSRGFKPGGRCLAVVAASLEDAAKKLTHSREKLSRSDNVRLQDRNGIFYQDEPLGAAGKVAFLFPGEGAQYPNMLRELALHFPEARDAFDQVDKACELAGDGFVPSAVIFPAPGTGGDAEEGALFEMEGAVEAVVSANTALTRIFQKLAIKPDAVVGHSSGEFMALEAAGIFRFDSAQERVQRICDGYLLMKEMTGVMTLPEGVLITVGGVEREVIDGLLKKHEGDLLVAMDNCPHQVVLCARPKLAAGLVEFLGSEGAIASPLPFNRPYHTPWFEPALDGLRAFFRKRPLHAPAVPTYSCASADLFPDDPAKIEELCVSQWGTTVRFRETIETMHDRGFRLFVEVGPRGNLTSFVDDILKGRPHQAIAANRMHKSSVVTLMHALGQLAAHGVAMDLTYLHERRGSTDLANVAKASRKGMVLSTATPEFDVGSVVAGVADPGSFRTRPASAAPAAVGGGIDSYFEAMEQFLDEQHEMVKQFLGSQAVATVEERTFPLLTEIVEHVDGVSLVAMGRYSAENEVFVKDHTLGTVEVSVLNPDLTGIPIMPMTCSLEIISEAASALIPGKVVTGLKDVRATRWISFDQGTANVRINARVLSGGGRVEVRGEIRDHVPDDPRAAFKPALIEATVVLEDAYPPAPIASVPPLKDAVKCDWVGDALYPDRLFHGPRMSGITKIGDWSQGGVTGTVEVLPRDDLIRSHPEPGFAMDPVLLDSVGAVLNMWGAYKPFDGIVFFPVRITEVRFFGPLLPVGTELNVQLRITGRTELTSIADITAIDDKGRVQVAVTGWEDRTFDITPVLHRMFLRAADSFVSDQIRSPLAHTVCCVSKPISAELLESSHRIWHKMLAFLVLDEEEREHWRTKDWTDRRRIQWLIGRAVVKDAVRIYLQEFHGLRLASPDIHIAKTEKGRPYVTGAWKDLAKEDLVVSFAHTDGVAVAIVGSAGDGELGIDVENLRPLSDDFIQGAFTADEKARLEQADERHETGLMMWCAKEAASKALGVGLQHDPRDLRVTEIVEGNVKITAAGDWARLAGEKTLSSLTWRRAESIISVLRFS